ncbi:hypothetical protein N7462_004691 [Penicillium macrosclerotiorum]|uniref:uncharacterized protein n=1 Tax=Penicillium macrosclerotiorum TaxID=303699 RepID=UPI002546689E|nr:uncharacterized protein N7462_004691 [Penicillium macrosclerotiorum]KAJ5690299.1 hypothetical protein N7462_004691 [Penicillium macrosclerotiorum]
MIAQDREQTNRGPKKDRQPSKSLNALQAGIKEFLKDPVFLSQQDQASLEKLQNSLPKRFTIYEPLVLLPANTFQSPPAWGAFCSTLSPEQRELLYASIAKAFNRLGATHLAVNAPIAQTNTQGQENRIRSPAGLIPLHGDFGTAISTTGQEEDIAQPSPADLESAFWVRTSQNQGIVQIWAPLYTMFSRGNITEKARILDQGPSQNTFMGLDEQSLAQPVSNTSVVDMYAGIGYFVFSYLKRGVKRVWGWELNGWSVEGLRRGCEANKWGCKVVRVLNNGELSIPVEKIMETLTDIDRVVVFHGDNMFAADVMSRIQRIMEIEGTWSPVRHINLGLLPSSQPSWDNACRILDMKRGGWLHVHENVDVREVEEKKTEIMSGLARHRMLVYQQQGHSEEPIVDCCHVEHVKSYAPGVMHCVFDIQLSAPRDPGN